MKDIQIIDLIIADINLFLIKHKINPVNVNLIQFNGVPIKCEGNISEDQKKTVNEHLKKYKDKFEIIKLVIEYRYGNTSKMSDKIGKKHIAQRYRNLLKTESELMELIGAEIIIKLK